MKWIKLKTAFDSYIVIVQKSKEILERLLTKWKKFERWWTAHEEKLETCTEAYPENMEVNQEELEANQEKYRNRTEHSEATHLRTDQEDRAYGVLHEAPKGATYKNTFGAT